MMTSCTVVLSGKTSELEANFFPPITLDGDYVCGLVDFQSYMSIPNITSRNNRIHYYKLYEIVLVARQYYTMEMLRDLYITEKPDATTRDLENFEKLMYDEFSQTNDIYQIETDINLSEAYEYFLELKDKKVKEDFKKIVGFDRQTRFVINSIPEEWVSKFKMTKSKRFFSSMMIPYVFNFHDAVYLELAVGSYELIDIEKGINKLMEPILPGFKFTSRLDKVTLKCTLHCTHKLFGKDENSVAKVFGFDGGKMLHANTFTEAKSPVNIMLVNVIKFECNIISGAYSNGKPVHTIHEFYPTVESGYKIVEVPLNVIYLPITTRSISNICVRAVDQDGNLVDFRGETITLRLHIKKL